MTLFRCCCILALAFIALSAPMGTHRALAQDIAEPELGRFSDVPICSDLINETGYTVYGTVETDTQPGPDGMPVHHKSTFRLAKGETTRICATGPFFEGGTVELGMRSLVPLFTCRTKLGQPITLSATRKESGQGFDWSATCYE